MRGHRGACPKVDRNAPPMSLSWVKARRLRYELALLCDAKFDVAAIN
jgi:hypothetical protein